MSKQLNFSLNVFNATTYSVYFLSQLFNLIDLHGRDKVMNKKKHTIKYRYLLDIDLEV
jgi:hypothetical protein